MLVKLGNDWNAIAEKLEAIRQQVHSFAYDLDNEKLRACLSDAEYSTLSQVVEDLRHVDGALDALAFQCVPKSPGLAARLAKATKRQRQ